MTTRSLLAALALAAALGVSAQTAAAAPSPAPEFTLAPGRVLVQSIAGYGGQLNQHVFADISGPPPELETLEARVLTLEPQFVRIFFNTSEWTHPDRMRSFVRTVGLAQRANAQINVTWQGSTFAVAEASMSRFADVLADLLENRGVDGLWVTLFNEVNSTRLTQVRYERVYRLLDDALRDRGVRGRVRFMGGDLLAPTSPLGETQADWFRYMATHMGDLLDAWSIHVFWDYWDTDKIERRLAREVRAIVDGLPEDQRRPLYVTEFGVRGLPTFEGEDNPQPGLWPDGRPMAELTTSAFQHAWLMIRAAQLGFVGALKWDLYNATYDAGTQDHSAIGPGSRGWQLRPIYHLIRLMTLVTKPGWKAVDIDGGYGSDGAKLLAGYTSAAGNVTIVGLDKDGAELLAPSGDAVPYSIGGLPPNTLFRLVFWNGDGGGTNAEIGFLDTGPSGIVSFSVPLQAVFALTSAPVALG